MSFKLERKEEKEDKKKKRRRNRINRYLPYCTLLNSELAIKHLEYKRECANLFA